MADSPTLPGPSTIQKGCGCGRNRLQAGPRLCHCLHRPKPQAKAGHLRYPRQGQGLSDPVLPVLREYGGDHNNIAEVVYDISPAFMAAIDDGFPGVNIIVDWSHVV
ncbi:hypothetical protein DFAR_1150017 [Desulfarculales bacterium]